MTIKKLNLGMFQKSRTQSTYRKKYKINILQAHKNFLILIKEIHE
jgi:hypothetical protein